MCDVCMIGGRKYLVGGDKIKDNIKLLKNYPVKDLEKLFKANKLKYDKELGRAENIAIFSLKTGFANSVGIVEKFVEKNKPSGKKGRKPRAKVVSKKRKLVNRVKLFKKRKGCDVKLTSKKAVLKSMVDKQKIKVKPAKKSKGPTKKDLQNSIKAYKKVTCPGLSKMKKADLEKFVKKHKIPIQLKIVASSPEIKRFIITTPERLMKKEANDSYEKNKEIYDPMPWAELAVDGYKVEDESTLEAAHKKALELHNLLKKTKKPKKTPAKKSSRKRVGKKTAAKKTAVKKTAAKKTAKSTKKRSSRGQRKVKINFIL